MKNTQVRNTAILVLVFAALLVGWWLVENYKPGAAPAPTTETSKYLFPALAVDNVEGIEVKLAAGPSVYLFKGAEGWFLGGMGGERLDDSAVINGASGIIELRAQRAFTEGVTLAEFGLDPPTATIKLTLTNKRTEALLVGSRNPEGFSYYVQHAGDPAIYLVSRYTVDTVLGWVDKPPRQPTPTPAAIVTVVATLTPPTAPVTTTAVVTPTPTATATPTPTPTPTPAGTVITVVVTPTPLPSVTPVVTPTVAITPTATTRP